MYITPESLSEFVKNLDILSAKMNRQTNEAIREAGTQAKTMYVNATPKRHGTAQGDVQLARVSTDGHYKSIKLGYGSASYWYMWFVHEGTYDKGNPKGIAPRKHIEKVLPTIFSTSQETMASILSRAFGG